jgi:hypothetical protein
MSSTTHRWFCFEVNGRYLGKVYADESSVRAAFPYSRIVGNLVSIYALARKGY